MMDTGLWPAVCERFTKQTGHRVEVIVFGPKHDITGAMTSGDADLLTMHASDAIINLVADGYGHDPQPWARNDLLLVGPPSDPAGIRGMTDAVEALRKIVSSESKLMVHRSLGAQEVLFNLLTAGQIEPAREQMISLPIDRHRELLQEAARSGAYTLVGRIPFRNGKIPDGDLAVMVEGDVRMRRPYIVIVAANAADTSPRAVAARELAHFLRSPETQAWLAEFGRGVLDDRPLFFPVAVADEKGESSAVLDTKQ
jgi:tungstate transport system substrate-binding protein